MIQLVSCKYSHTDDRYNIYIESQEIFEPLDCGKEEAIKIIHKYTQDDKIYRIGFRDYGIEDKAVVLEDHKTATFAHGKEKVSRIYLTIAPEDNSRIITYTASGQHISFLPNVFIHRHSLNKA